MMNTKDTAVIYYSKYGSTAQYARWIAEALGPGAELIDARARKLKYRDLAPYDTIVYGGGSYSGGIKGVELITKNWSKGLASKRVIVFAVGVAVDIPANRDQCMEINFKQRLISWTTGDAAADAGASAPAPDDASASGSAPASDAPASGSPDTSASGSSDSAGGAGSSDGTAAGSSESLGLKELLSQKMMPVQCFFLPGALDPAGLKGLDRHIMNLTRKMIGDGASGSTADNADVVRRLNEGCNLVDKDAIRPIVEAARS